jgi:SAM-dependent methyltransferase
MVRCNPICRYAQQRWPKRADSTEASLHRRQEVEGLWGREAAIDTIVVSMSKPSPRATAKDLARRIVPHSWRPQLRSWYNRLTWPLYLGQSVTCNCCKGHFRRFRSWSDEKNILWPMCPRCGSLGRMRVDWLFLTSRTDLLEGPKRLLHVAPEVCIGRHLERLPDISYLSADYGSALAMEQMDITDIRYPDESFDVVLCNHVIVYIDDDRQALKEVFRVLQPGGWALLQVPIDLTRDETYEDASVTDPHERHRVFGQYDHVRIYGRDYLQRLEEAGFEVSVDEFVKELPPSTIEQLGLDTAETIYLCRKR